MRPSLPSRPVEVEWFQPETHYLVRPGEPLEIQLSARPTGTSLVATRASQPKSPPRKSSAKILCNYRRRFAIFYWKKLIGRVLAVIGVTALSLFLALLLIVLLLTGMGVLKLDLP